MTTRQERDAEERHLAATRAASVAEMRKVTTAEQRRAFEEAAADPRARLASTESRPHSRVTWGRLPVLVAATGTAVDARVDYY